MEETIFQKIIDGRIPADKVHETDTTLAFLDINPTAKGHTLVVPKVPTKDIVELDDDSAGDLMQTIVTVAKAVKKATGAPAVNDFLKSASSLVVMPRAYKRRCVRRSYGSNAF